MCRSFCSQGVSVPGPIFLPGESLSRAASVQGGLWPGEGSLSRGVSAQGALCQGGLCPGGGLPTESEKQVVRIIPECFLVMIFFYNDYLKM